MIVGFSDFSKLSVSLIIYNNEIAVARAPVRDNNRDWIPACAGTSGVKDF